MDRQVMAVRYVTGWNKKNVGDVVRLMHPQASYHDTFWGETVSADDFPAYLKANFAEDKCFFRIDGDIIPTQDGVIIRYTAFSDDDVQMLAPLYNGADVLTIADGLIRTATDFYCDPNPLDLIAIATETDERHSESQRIPLGMSARTSSQIKRKLADLVSDMTIIRDPKLTVSSLAEHVGCSVMHLFHVLEEEKGTTFVDFIGECRSRYATTLLLESPGGDLDMRRISRQCGFTTLREFILAFEATFRTTPEQYLGQFSKQQIKN